MSGRSEGPRERVKQRSGALMALIIGPVVLVVTAIKVLEPHHFPPGDIRNEPWFWITLGIAALVLVTFIMVGSIRALRRDANQSSKR